MTGLRIIRWKDFAGVTHAFRQSMNHPNDWDPVCGSVTRNFGSRDIERVMAAIRMAAYIPELTPVTCVVCAARLTE